MATAGGASSTAAERAERASCGRAAARFVREKACFVTLQAVVLVLLAQAALRYASVASSSAAATALAAPASAQLGFFQRTRGAFSAVAGSDRPIQALFAALAGGPGLKGGRRAAAAAGAGAGAGAAGAGGAPVDGAATAAAATAVGAGAASSGGRRRRRGAGGGSGGGAAGSGGGGGSPDAESWAENTIFTPHCSAQVESKYAGDVAPPIVDVAIASECNSRPRRDAVRKGWGAFAKTLGIRYRFFVGQSHGEKEDAHCEAAIGAEMRRFDDIVMLPLIDTYENLTQKIMGMMTYTAHCSNGLFFAKCDDDVFVYAWRLQQRLLALQNDTSVTSRALGVYMGNFWIDSKPIKEDWHKNHEANYAGGYFPPYAGGPFYVLSRSGVRFVLDNARRLNSKWRNEDMAVGTWFTGADVKIVQEWKIKLLNWKHHEKPYIAEHAIDYDDSVEAWHGRLHTNFSCVGC